MAIKKEKVPKKDKKTKKAASKDGDDFLSAAASELSLAATNRNSTGVLTSHPDSRDIKIESFSLNYYSQNLILETTIELNFGRRYGLIGANGCGKSTFMECLANREVPIPDHMDIHLLNGEYPPTDLTALEAVIADAQKELDRLEALMEKMMADDPESPLLDDIYERMDNMDASLFEAKAGKILHGLGFTTQQMQKKTSDLSGGWRMRVALARALFVRPTLLLLDQPTNHLDLGAVVWLEEYLKSYDRILVIISHSQDFLNNVCTNIMEVTMKKELTYYAGNYDTFIKTKSELEVNQTKAYEKQQTEIEHMQKFIRSCGTYSNLVRQAKSRQKILDKMEAAGLVEKVLTPPEFRFTFNGAGQLPPPVLSFTDVSFAWNGKLEDAIYRNMDLGVDTESRVALVGPNGAGKSTLLKLMMNEIAPTRGTITRHSRLKLCKYSQHSAEQLDASLSAIDYLRGKFPEASQELQYWRGHVGKFGLTGSSQLCPIGQLSDGQKSRVVFAELSLLNATILLLDEPTNALDIETIDSLADAINNFNGGVVLVSHDFRLISQVAKEIWLCENGEVHPFEGSISDYKKVLRKDVLKDF